MIIIKSFIKELFKGGGLTLKKTLTFIPLGIAISAAIIYLLNVFNYRVTNNSLTTLQILSNLRVYLYISVSFFVLYFLIKVLFTLTNKKNNEIKTEEQAYKPFEIKKEERQINNEEVIPEVKAKPIIKEVIITGNKYCSNCGEKIFDTDTYCKNCGSYQKDKKSGLNPVLKNVINVLEIVILILVLYFLINLLFEYKERNDPNFKSPFNVSMTK